MRKTADAVGRKDCRVTLAQRVLVVDGLAETEEVLRAVLEPKGLEVDRIRGAGHGRIARQQLAAKRPPSVVVLHVEEGLEPISDVRGLAGRPPDSDRCHEDRRPRPAVATVEHYLEKPFQYGELIRTIERLSAAANC